MIRNINEHSTVGFINSCYGKMLKIKIPGKTSVDLKCKCDWLLLKKDFASIETIGITC